MASETQWAFDQRRPFQIGVIKRAKQRNLLPLFSSSPAVSAEVEAEPGHGAAPNDSVQYGAKERQGRIGDLTGKPKRERHSDRHPAGLEGSIGWNRMD